ncbi:MAG: MFS transporter [Candidatus Kariarchaeaceae archaeon]
MYTKDQFKSWYLVLIGFFYAGQGYALGSMVLLLPLYILNELDIGVRSEAVAISALIIFPWYIKFVFGIISDYFPIRNYRRKPYLIVATLFSLLGWTTLGMSDTVYPYFVLSGVALAIGSALGDAVIDGLSVEITPDHFIGRLQGVNWGSRGLGLGAAGYISSNIVDVQGWDTLFVVAGTFGVIITVITLILPEVGAAHLDLDPNPRVRLQELFGKLSKIFTRGRTANRVAYFLFSGFALSIILQLTLIMETEFGYDFDTIGIGALFFAFGSFFGSILNGILTDRSDTFSGFLGLSAAYALAIMGGLAFVNYRDFPAELLFFAFIGIFGGAYEAYQLKIIQEETTPDLESTIFSIYTGISNIGQFAFGGLLIVILADRLGISILVSMQVVVLILGIAGYFLYKLKFSDEEPKAQ